MQENETFTVTTFDCHSDGIGSLLGTDKNILL
jgi:hypothetical protein